MTHILYLEKSEVWYCDGTFKSCPRNFEQIYTIMGSFRVYNLPFVYIIMKNKSFKSYFEAFDYLKSLIQNSTKFITIDFEMAAFIALKKVFVNAEISGCFFHFNEILFRNIQKFGLKSYYKSNSEFRECFKLFLSLALVPKDHLTDEISKIENHIQSNINIKEIHVFWKISKKDIAKT
ncbi:hypothetical protein DMUE_2819 [Dictyocoela muelleri]|nr:hypothetical protein DMUE_2819 [Dictyocoela muelleri]